MFMLIHVLIVVISLCIDTDTVSLELVPYNPNDYILKETNPVEVGVPSKQLGEPEFIARAGWFDELFNKILNLYKSGDSGMLRVTPLGLVRCSRGGKSRTLKEIA